VQLITNSWMAGGSPWMAYQANKGYIVYTVDGRGSENRGREFEQKIFRNLGEFEVVDQLSAAEYLMNLDYVDRNKMAVHGWSYGGFMTTSLMLKAPGIFKVGVAGGPVIDWKYYEIMYTERYMDTPEKNPSGYAKASLLDKVQNLKGDLLLIHGADDDVVVPQNSIDLLKQSVDKGVQLDFFLYPGHKHNVRGKDRVHLMEKVLSYIDEKLD
jgi:dipeptidyl-peptidase-4